MGVASSTCLVLAAFPGTERPGAIENDPLLAVVGGLPAAAPSGVCLEMHEVQEGHVAQDAIPAAKCSVLLGNGIVEHLLVDVLVHDLDRTHVQLMSEVSDGPLQCSHLAEALLGQEVLLLKQVLLVHLDVARIPPLEIDLVVPLMPGAEPAHDGATRETIRSANFREDRIGPPAACTPRHVGSVSRGADTSRANPSPQADGRPRGRLTTAYMGCQGSGDPPSQHQGADKLFLEGNEKVATVTSRRLGRHGPPLEGVMYEFQSAAESARHSGLSGALAGPSFGRRSPDRQRRAGDGFTDKIAWDRHLESYLTARAHRATSWTTGP